MDGGLRTTRNVQEQLSDALLTLVLYSGVQAVYGRGVGDRLKATKHLFLACYTLFVQRKKAFNFSFYRYNQGPFTAEVYDTWQELTFARLLRVHPDPRGPIEVTAEGQAFGQEFSNEVLGLRENATVTEAIEATVDATASLRTPELLDHVYAMRVTPVGWNEALAVRDVPHNVYLTKVLEPVDASSWLHIPTSWHRRFQLLQFRTMAELVGPGKPVFNGLTLSQVEDLDASLSQEDSGLLDKIDLDEVRSRYGLS